MEQNHQPSQTKISNEQIDTQGSTSNPPGYKIRGTKVFSPYPVQLTPAEIRLVFSLQRYFKPENILADYYAPRVNFRSRYAADTSNFTLDACHKNLAGSETVQIDALAVSEDGVFIFESKDFSGWIYGDENSQNWTQVLNFGKTKHQFYNPIRQNRLHIDAVRDFLDPQIPFYSIVVFGNQATLKTKPPTALNTYICTQSHIANTLAKCHPHHPLSPTQIAQILADLKHHCVPPTTIVRQEHISETQNALTKMQNYS